MDNRYITIPNLDDHTFEIWDEEKRERIAVCAKRWDALHICQVLNGVHAMIAAVKQ